MAAASMLAGNATQTNCSANTLEGSAMIGDRDPSRSTVVSELENVPQMIQGALCAHFYCCKSFTQ